MNKAWLKFPLYLAVHPYDAYWELKYELRQQTILRTAFVILALLAMTMILQNQYNGFLVNFAHPQELNSIMEIVFVVIPVLFFSIANWSLTTLLDGEGKFTEIFTSTCFALFPIILIQVPWIVLSNFISLEEASFFYFSGSVAAAWSLYLLFVGNMTVHQFTPMKTILTLCLTAVAMAFMAFLCLLFFSLIQQIVSFVMTIYQEISLRK